MDYKLQERMEQELLRFHRELETTFVYMTHDQTQAMRLADQMVVMNDGQVEHSGPVREVYNQPRMALIATFVGGSNLLSGTVTDVDVRGTAAVIDTDFDTFHISTVSADSKPENLVDRPMVFAIRLQFVRPEDGKNGFDCDVNDVVHHSGEGTQIIMTARRNEGTRQIQAKSDDRVEPVTDAVAIDWNADDVILLERTSVAGDVDLQEDILGEQWSRGLPNAAVIRRGRHVLLALSYA